MRWLVVRGVMGGVVWAWGAGGHCRVWGRVMGLLVGVAGGGTRGGVCRQGHQRQSVGGGCRLLRLWPGPGEGAGEGGVRVALLVMGGAGVGVVLAGGLRVPVGPVGVACVCRVVLAAPGWLWCSGEGGRRPHGRLGGAVVRM